MATQPPVPVVEIRPTVRTLMGQGSFEASVICLKSVVQASHEPFDLVIHNDGTLDQDHKDILLSQLSTDITFVDRKEADETVFERIAKYKHCREYRIHSPLALKLFDIVILNNGLLNFVDSDIFFYHSVTNLFSSQIGTINYPRFMDNTTDSYAVRPWHLAPLGSLHLAKHINTGFILGWDGDVDLDYLNWLLGKIACSSVFQKRLYWVEQTCWAALAARRACLTLDEKQVILASKNMGNVNPDTVAIHFVSTFRDRLSAFRSKTSNGEQLPIEIRTKKVVNTNCTRILWSDVKRRLIW